ncbi:MAG: hypothetical protein Q9167_000734 [Letrouitia subvulpina]
MWTRVLGKLNNTQSQPSSSSGQRKDGSQPSKSRRSDSIRTSESSREASKREGQSQDFTSTSQYSSAAFKSIGSAYIYDADGPINVSSAPPEAVRNTGPVDPMANSSRSHDERYTDKDSSRTPETQNDDFSNKERKRSKTERREKLSREEHGQEKKERRKKGDKGRKDTLERGSDVFDVAYEGTGRAAGSFPKQTGGSSSVRLPGSRLRDELDGNNGVSRPSSSLVQDQFPGQFPSQASAPYRPPLASSEGGPGLAAEYYGDTGQSVADQPGFRKNSPSLIVGAEPHLQAASAVAAPPPEPSATGGVGAAASFYSDSFNAEPAADAHQSNSQSVSVAPAQTTFPSSNDRPSNGYHPPSVSSMPTLAAGAAAGAAAGYFAASQPLDQEYHGNYPSQISSQGEVSIGTNSHPQNLGSYGSLSTTNVAPSKPNKHSSQSTNIPLAIAGAAGLAVAAYHHGHNHHGSSSSSSSGSPTTHQYVGGSMAQRHRHRGPLSKLVDFFKDPEGVAQFEEYTEYIGVCKYCFAPGSSPREAPRKHHYRRRRSLERFGNSSRIDKDSRYWSSEGEGRRRSQKSWIEKGLTGYGLAKVTRSLFDQSSGSDSSYRIQPGRTQRSQSRGSNHSADRKSRTSRGVTGRSSEERLRSWDRKSGVAEAALGAATGLSVVRSASPKYNRPTEKVVAISDRRSRERSPHRTPFLGPKNEGQVNRHISRHTPSSPHKGAYEKKKKKKSGGFFAFGNESSSSSELDVISGLGTKRRKDDNRKIKTKQKTSDDANAALMGLGAAATALALSQNQKLKHRGNGVLPKGPKGKSGRSSRHGHKGEYSPSSDEDLWESASEGEYSSTDLDLAYGAVRRSQSGESLSSASSSFDKWDWRQASKREKRPLKIGSSPPASGDRKVRNGREQDGISSTGSAPLQHVYPISTSDPSRFDVIRNEPEASSYVPLIHSRPDPVPIQHPQPVAPVSSMVYTSRGGTYEHSNSAPTRPSVDANYPIYPYTPDKYYTRRVGSNEPTPVTSSSLPPGVIPTTETSKQDRRIWRSDSSPPVHSPGINDQATRAPKRTSTRDDISSVRFDLTKEQKDNHRREEQRRQKREDKERRLRKESSQIETQSQIEHESRSSDQSRTRESTHSSEFGDGMRIVDSKKESWTTPVAAGAVAATIGAIVGEDISRKKNNNDNLPHRGRRTEDHDVDVVVHERHVSPERIDAVEKTESSQSSREKKEAVSIWQAAAKIRRSSSHENYAAYFTPPELLSKNGEAKQTTSANADNDIIAYQIPEVIPVEPRERPSYSQTRIHSLPARAGEAETGANFFPWPVPTLTISEPTPPTSRSGSVIGDYSPLDSSRDPTVPDLKEVNVQAEPLEPLTPLESTVAPEVSWEDPGAVEYTIIEPKERRRDSLDSSPSEVNAIETTPGISSLKYRSSRDRSSSDHGDDIEFAATVAAGLQESGFDPSIVINDPSFPRRDSPPGSEKGRSSRSPPTGLVTEISSRTPSVEEIPSPNKVSYEELSERHMPGSFGADHEGEETQRLTFDRSEREEANSMAEPGSPSKPSTEPADNATIKPKTYSAEPEPLEPKSTRDVAIDPNSMEDVSMDDKTSHQQPSVELPRNVDENYEYVPDNASINAPSPASFKQDLPPNKMKKSKHRSSGFEDTTSMASASTTSENVVSSQFQTKEDRKGGLFGLFGKKSEILLEGNEARETPTEASLEDFEEPKQKRKKSKGRKSTRDGSELPSKLTERAKGNKEDSWGDSKEVQSGEVKPYDDGDAMRTEPGRMTQDLPAESYPLATLESGLGPQSNDVLTNLEDQVPASNIENFGREDGHTVAFVSPSERDLHSPSFLEMRPEMPPSPNISPLQHDPGGTALPGSFMGRESSLPDSPLPSAKLEPRLKPSFEPDQADGDAPVSALQEKEVSPTARADTQKWRLSDIQPESRQNPFTSPSPTAVPLRPLRFGRSPSSPGLSKSTASTPHVPSSVDAPFTPRKRERPHSTEFKSNEFRPMWLLEKHGSRQEFAPQETYPSLPSSHSTSRSSSMHEADDLDQIRQYSMAISDLGGRPQLEQHGLYIDTSQHAMDSELLDSQQATPTAASFHSSRRQDPPFQLGSQSTELSGWIPTLEPGEIPKKNPPTEERLLSTDKTIPQRQPNSLQRRKSETTNDRPYFRERRFSSPIRSNSQAKITESVSRSTIFNTIIGSPAVSAPKLSNKYDQTSEWSPGKPGADFDSIAKQTISQPFSSGNDKTNSEEIQVPHERAQGDGTGRSLYPDELLSQSEEEKPTNNPQETARIQIGDILVSPIKTEDKLQTLSDFKPTDTAKAIDSHEQLVDQTDHQVPLKGPSTILNQPDTLPKETGNSGTLEDIGTTRQSLGTAAETFPQDQREEVPSISSLGEAKQIDDNNKAHPSEESSRGSLPPEHPYDYRLTERSDKIDKKSTGEDTLDADGTESQEKSGKYPIRQTIIDGSSETEANIYHQSLIPGSGCDDQSIEGLEPVNSEILEHSLPIDSAIRSQDSNSKSNNLDTNLSPENIPLPMGEDSDLNDTTPESLYLATDSPRYTDHKLLDNDGTQISLVALKNEITSTDAQTSYVMPEGSRNSLSVDEQLLERGSLPRESIAEGIEESFSRKAENTEGSVLMTETEPEKDIKSQKLNIGNDPELESSRMKSPEPVSLEAPPDLDLTKSQARNEPSTSADRPEVGATSLLQEHLDSQQASVEKTGSTSSEPDFSRDVTIPIEDPGQDKRPKSSKKKKQKVKKPRQSELPEIDPSQTWAETRKDRTTVDEPQLASSSTMQGILDKTLSEQQQESFDEGRFNNDDSYSPPGSVQQTLAPTKGQDTEHVQRTLLGEEKLTPLSHPQMTSGLEMHAQSAEHPEVEHKRASISSDEQARRSAESSALAAGAADAAQPLLETREISESSHENIDEHMPVLQKDSAELPRTNSENNEGIKGSQQNQKKEQEQEQKNGDDINAEVLSSVFPAPIQTLGTQEIADESPISSNILQTSSPPLENKGIQTIESETAAPDLQNRQVEAADIPLVQSHDPNNIKLDPSSIAEKQLPSEVKGTETATSNQGKHDQVFEMKLSGPSPLLADDESIQANAGAKEPGSSLSQQAESADVQGEPKLKATVKKKDKKRSKKSKGVMVEDEEELVRAPEQELETGPAGASIQGDVFNQIPMKTSDGTGPTMTENIEVIPRSKKDKKKAKRAKANSVENEDTFVAGSTKVVPENSEYRPEEREKEDKATTEPQIDHPTKLSEISRKSKKDKKKGKKAGALPWEDEPHTSTVNHSLQESSQVLIETKTESTSQFDEAQAVPSINEPIKSLQATEDWSNEDEIGKTKYWDETPTSQDVTVKAESNSESTENVIGDDLTIQESSKKSFIDFSEGTIDRPFIRASDDPDQDRQVSEPMPNSKKGKKKAKKAKAIGAEGLPASGTSERTTFQDADTSKEDVPAVPMEEVNVSRETKQNENAENYPVMSKKEKKKAKKAKKAFTWENDPLSTGADAEDTQLDSKANEESIVEPKLTEDSRLDLPDPKSSTGFESINVVNKKPVLAGEFAPLPALKPRQEESAPMMSEPPEADISTQEFGKPALAPIDLDNNASVGSKGGKEEKTTKIIEIAPKADVVSAAEGLGRSRELQPEKELKFKLNEASEVLSDNPIQPTQESVAPARAQGKDDFFNERNTSMEGSMEDANKEFQVVGRESAQNEDPAIGGVKSNEPKTNASKEKPLSNVAEDLPPEDTLFQSRNPLRVLPDIIAHRAGIESVEMAAGAYEPINTTDSLQEEARPQVEEANIHSTIALSNNLQEPPGFERVKEVSTPPMGTSNVDQKSQEQPLVMDQTLPGAHKQEILEKVLEGQDQALESHETEYSNNEMHPIKSPQTERHDDIEIIGGFPKSTSHAVDVSPPSIEPPPSTKSDDVTPDDERPFSETAMKKSRRSKKSKKPQPVRHELQQATETNVSELPSKSSAGQSTATDQAYKQIPSPRPAELAPAIDDMGSVGESPTEPPPTAEVQDDYFGPISPRQGSGMPKDPKIIQQRDENDEPYEVVENIGIPTLRKSLSREPQLKTDDTLVLSQPPEVHEEAVSVEKEPIKPEAVLRLDETEDSSPKKGKKAKRKRKSKAIEDVMWEFPAMKDPEPHLSAGEIESKNEKGPQSLQPPITQSYEPEMLDAGESQADKGRGTSQVLEPSAERELVKDKPYSEPAEPKGAEEFGLEDSTEVSLEAQREKEVEKYEMTGKNTLEIEDKSFVRPNQEASITKDPLATSQHQPPSNTELTTAAGLNATIEAAESLKHGDRKKDKKNKKGKKAEQWRAHSQEAEERMDKPTTRTNDEATTNNLAKSTSSGPSILREAKTQQHRTPPPIPESASYAYSIQEGSVPTEDQRSSKSVNRDSAVHVADSPRYAEKSPTHRYVRDSGYPETEASMLSDFEPEPSTGVQNQRLEAVPQSEDYAINPQIRTPRHADPAQADRFEDSIGVHQDPDYSNLKGGRGRRYSSPSSLRETTRNDDFLHEDRVDKPARSHEREFSEHNIREPSPVSSTSKDRSSVLFHSSPSTREITGKEQKQAPPQTNVVRSTSEPEASNIPAQKLALDTSKPIEPEMVTARAESLAALSGLKEASQTPRPSLFGGPIGISSDVASPPLSPSDPQSSDRRRLNTITEYSPEESPLNKKARHLSDVGSPDRGVKSARRSETPQSISKRREKSPPTQGPGKGMISTDELIAHLSWPPVDEEKHSIDLERSRSRGAERRLSSHHSQTKPHDGERRSASGTSDLSVESINAIIKTPDQVRSASGMSNRSSGTPPLRRADRSVSGDLRGASKEAARKRAKQSRAEVEVEAGSAAIGIPSSSTYDPVKDKGKGRVREMADVYEGYGDFHGSPLSPTRPPSMRRRQSMQVLELESKLDQLTSENRLLQDAKSRAEKNLEDATHDRSQEISSYREGLETRDLWLRQKDTELSQLKQMLEGLQSQVSQLTEVNENLSTATRGLDDHEQKYSQLEADNAHALQQWQLSARELEELRQQHSQLSAGMEDIVRHEVAVALEERNAELRHVRDELEVAREQVRTLQAQILASKRSDDLIVDRDEDYFDTQCQALCQHVQQWVLRFSKFSDMRACYLANEVKDEKVIDRMENAILDGSDFDIYLADRVKRRDVFMSVVMTMIWEFIFTRYLFGMDREQRQKLKALEKTLSEVGPMSAVHKWRATTLNLLTKRESFATQRAQDTEAVMHTIYETLATFLPPPPHLVMQIQNSLLKVLSAAVDLSIEMRTQRAEYIMLPPLQPEYDINGDLARKVYFNAALMNERSGMTSSNEALEQQQAVVRMVLFPLVVKKGDDAGQGTEEIVVCPAQVLVAPGAKDKKTVRVMSAQGERSEAGSDVGMGNMF